MWFSGEVLPATGCCQDARHRRQKNAVGLVGWDMVGSHAKCMQTCNPPKNKHTVNQCKSIVNHKELAKRQASHHSLHSQKSLKHLWRQRFQRGCLRVGHACRVSQSLYFFSAGMQRESVTLVIFVGFNIFESALMG